MNRSDLSANIINVNFDDKSKAKLYSSNCSLELDSKNLKEIFDEAETSNIKLDGSINYKDKSRNNFLDDMINLLNSPKNKKSESPMNQTKDSMILNLDESSTKNKHRKNSLSCSDLNTLIKNFDIKISVKGNENEKITSKVQDYLNKEECRKEEMKNSGRNSLDNSFRKKKENFIPKSELFSRCEDSQKKIKDFKCKETKNQINPILN
jgi:hypothetical protein